ncbi:MAG: CTP synthase [Nitrososphaerota archaeon]
MPKYIFVTGGVVSSVGKGIVAASVGRILQARGYKVTAIKIDPYLNVDSGTMNPYAHGEVFVTDDGGETDLDIGWYERFLDITLSKRNNITTGQVYLEVITKERRGDYLGKCVQIVPHITDEIKRRIRLAAENDGVDIAIVEIGGTAGDIEGQPFLEAARQMRLEEGFENTLFIHVALVPILKATEEFKTKALQHSVNELRRIGIQPDAIVARCEKPIDKATRSKIALFGTLPESAVFCSYDVEHVYEVPLILEEQGMGVFITGRLNLSWRQPRLKEWSDIVASMKNAREEVRIAVCGKYTKLIDSYVSVREALIHAAAYAGAKAIIDWIDTEEFEAYPEKVNLLSRYDGILVPGGFGQRGVEGKINVIKYSRENGIPFLGICFGMQLSVVEYARNVCGLEGANSTEVAADTPHPVIDLLPEQRSLENLGGTMRLGAFEIIIKPGTLAYKLYNTRVTRQRHRHRYEVNPAYWDVLTRAGMVFSGMSEDGRRVEIIELPSHPYFIATQYHAEFVSKPGKPEAAYLGFIRAALNRRKNLENYSRSRNISLPLR